MTGERRGLVGRLGAGGYRAVVAAAAVAVLAVGASAAEFVAGPYLANPRQDGMTVCWVTDEAKAGQVEYGATAACGQTAAVTVCDQVVGSAPARFVCKARLRGLEAGKTWHYRVSGGGLTGERSGQFTIPKPDQPIVAVFCGDWTLINDKDIAFVEKALGRSVDLVIDVGDTGQHGTIFQFAGKFWQTKPYVLAKGNHCNEGKDKQEIQHYFDFENGLAHNVDYGLARFVVSPYGSYSKAYTKEQLAWIEDSLAKSPRRWKIFVQHQVAFSDSNHGTQVFKQNNPYEEGYLRRQAAWPIFMKYGCRLALNGHDHCWQRTWAIDKDGKCDPSGVVNVTVSTGPYKQMRQSPWMAKFGNWTGPTYLKVEADRLTMESFARPDKRSKDGQYVKQDSVTIPLEGPIPQSPPPAAAPAGDTTPPHGEMTPARLPQPAEVR